MLGYQDALWPTGTVEGERGCAERWGLIAPELPEAGILLDIGSNLGFYGISAARRYRDLAVISVEADGAIASRQAKIVAANRLNNMIVLEGSLNGRSAEAWSETCEMVECCLLLSVLHWFDEPDKVLGALSRISRTLVVELPAAEDAGACGHEKRMLWGENPIAWVQDLTGRQVRLIGRPSRHTGDVPSWLLVVEGPIEREPSVPYFGSSYEHPGGRDYRLRADQDGVRLWVRGVERPWIPGVNIANLAVLGRCGFPAFRQLKKWWKVARDAAPQHLDPAPHNVVWGAHGFVLIDGEDLDGRINRPDRQMREFLRRWARDGGYDGGALRRIDESRPADRVRALVRRLPDPVKRLLRPVIRKRVHAEVTPAEI